MSTSLSSIWASIQYVERESISLKRRYQADASTARSSWVAGCRTKQG
jgi:hypothetical protein